MSNLRRIIFWVALYLVAILILGQFDYDDSPIIDFAKYFYFLGMIAVPATLFLPKISRIHVAVPLIIWGAVYLVVLNLVDRTASSPKGNFAIILLEFILIEAGVWLAHQLAVGISHAESIMDAMALTAFPNRTQDIVEANQRIKYEFMRSRRYHRSLSLLLLQVRFEDHLVKEIIKSVQHDLSNRFSYARISQIVDECVRQTDIVMREHSGRFIILCPETDNENLDSMAKRIAETIQQRTGIQVVYGVASFPEEALNFDDLLERAKEKLLHSPLFSDKNHLQTSPKEDIKQ